MISYENAVSRYKEGQKKFQEIIAQDGVTSRTFPKNWFDDDPKVTLHFTGGAKNAKLVAGTINRDNGGNPSEITVVFGDNENVAHYSNVKHMYVEGEKVLAGFVCNNSNGNGVEFVCFEDCDYGVAREVTQDGDLLAAHDLVETKLAQMKKYAR